MSLNGLAAIQDIDDFVATHEQRHEDLSPQEKHDLEIVRRDAIQSIFQQQDAWLFSEFDRLKLVELEYLYQIRGVRQVMPSAIFREGYECYGNSWTGSKIRLLYPQDRKRGGRESREPFLPINKILETKNLTEQLVTLRIDLATDKYRLKDRILWNVDDTTIPLELFVENVLEDYGLPLTLAQDVSKSLQDQISNHLPHIYPQQGAAHSVQISEVKGETAAEAGKETSPAATAGADVKSELPSEAPASSGAAETTSSSGAPLSSGAPSGATSGSPSSAGAPSSAPSGAPSSAPSLPETGGESSNLPEGSQPTSQNNTDNSQPAAAAEYDEDLRITIKLDITIGHHQLIDQFEWDINNPDNDPEMFGLILANELSLPLEFSTAISHAIREQSQAYTRALFRSGYQFDGKPPHDKHLQNETAMPVGEDTFLRRPELLPLFSPALNDVKIGGYDHDDQETEKRELRSRRRQGRSSRRTHHNHHDIRLGGGGSVTGDLMTLPQDLRGPDFCTPVYSGVLPGGLDRNLSILHMTACLNDDSYGGDKQDLVYYFNKHRRERQVQSASQFDENMMKLDKPRWLVKLKVPKEALQAL